MKEKFNYIKEWILSAEGGYTECKDGSDYSCTMKGVTIETYRRFFGKDKTCSDLRVIKESEWDKIFREGYYNPMMADKIKNWSIAKLCVDMVYMSGVYAIKRIQKSLGCVADGIVGPKTLKALNNENSKAIFDRLWKMRENWFKEIVWRNPAKKKYLNGWLNRLNKIKYEEG